MGLILGGICLYVLAVILVNAVVLSLLVWAVVKLVKKFTK